MSMSDPLADMLSRIRNAGLTRLEKVEVPASKVKLRVAEILRDEGYIQDFRVVEDPRQDRRFIAGDCLQQRTLEQVPLRENVLLFLRDTPVVAFE